MKPTDEGLDTILSIEKNTKRVMFMGAKCPEGCRTPCPHGTEDNLERGTPGRETSPQTTPPAQGWGTQARAEEMARRHSTKDRGSIGLLFCPVLMFIECLVCSRCFFMDYFISPSN